MGGKGGGGGGSNTQAIQMQQQAANEARMKEIQREQRLQEGTAAINALYDPTPIMGTRHQRGRVSASNLPAGFRTRTGTAAAAPAAAAASDEWTPAEITMGRRIAPAAGAAAAGPQEACDEAGYLAMNPDVAKSGATGQQHWDLYGQKEGRKGGKYTFDPNAPNQIVDPQGNVILASADPNAGIDTEWDETYDTGQKKDRFQDLYDRYESGQRNFYMPELQKQYGDARKKAYLAHAGAGTLWSSSRGDTEADIASQNALNQGQIESQIQDSLGGLRRQIASDKSSLINQLYATENPTMAANEALARTKTISQQTPPLSPMGDLFKIAAIGLGNAFGQANDPFNRVRNQGVGSTSSGFNRPA